MFIFNNKSQMNDRTSEVKEYRGDFYYKINAQALSTI